LPVLSPDELEGGEGASAELAGFLATANDLCTTYLSVPTLSVRPLSVHGVATAR
jgi:hypothetical protein